MRLPQEDLCQALAYSPNLKYETDGGPGILEIMQLLQGSQNTKTDREIFFRSQILFYLLAAIDGHAKNFSIFISPDGRYHLTPLYDIISTHPLIDTKQLQQKKIKMAMALHGKNKHYHWNKIQKRHFIETARKTSFPSEFAETIIQGMLDEVDNVIEKTSKILPEKFPTKISNSIFNGMKKAKKKLEA